jgi:hypothetical protein
MKTAALVLLTAPALATLTSCLPPDQGQDLGQTFRQADAVSCEEQRRSLELAVESYRAIQGVLPTKEADLVPKFLVSETPDYDIDANANIVPTLVGRCGAATG